MTAIPSEEDWDNYKEDLDATYAHNLFIGKSNEQMLPEYKGRVLARWEDIFSMPKKPFQYYIFGFREFVILQNFGFCESSDAASSFLNLILVKLEKQPDYILPVIEKLFPDIEFLANNQELYDADESIYGNFKDKLAAIREFAGKIA
jgi:hypothetical protein